MGYSGARYKGFNSLSEAQQFTAGNAQTNAQVAPPVTHSSQSYRTQYQAPQAEIQQVTTISAPRSHIATTHTSVTRVQETVDPAAQYTLVRIFLDSLGFIRSIVASWLFKSTSNVDM